MQGEGECGEAEDKDRPGKRDKGGASIAAAQREITLILDNIDIPERVDNVNDTIEKDSNVL